jgi:hypothetical protein
MHKPMDHACHDVRYIRVTSYCLEGIIVITKSKLVIGKQRTCIRVQMQNIHFYTKQESSLRLTDAGFIIPPLISEPRI